jgi:hypothetical protein
MLKNVYIRNIVYYGRTRSLEITENIYILYIYVSRIIYLYIKINNINNNFYINNNSILNVKYCFI